MKTSLVNGILLGTGGVGVIGAGGYLAWRSQQPTDVRSRLVWEGLSVADSKTLGVYKAIYLAKHNEAGFSSFATVTDKDTAAPILRTKCNDLLDVSISDDRYEKSLEEAKKWCLVPEKTTVEISLLLEDSVFSSSEDDYKNTFVLNKDNKTFIDVINKGDSGTTLDVTTGFPKLQAWCSEAMKKTPTSVDLKNAKEWCLKGPSSIREKLERDGLRMIGDGGWAQVYGKHKSTPTFLTDIGVSSPADPQLSDSQGGDKLKTWCNEKVGLKLYENANYPSTYEKVKGYCTSI